MIKISSICHSTSCFDDVLMLPFDKRQKSRQRVQLKSGFEAGLMLPRGTVLRGGDCLMSDDGKVIVVQAEPEQTSKVVSNEVLLLMRAAYHLGNRHVPLAVTGQSLRYLQDHVLDEMVGQLGLEVIHESAPFEPESGAYASGHKHHQE